MTDILLALIAGLLLWERLEHTGLLHDVRVRVARQWTRWLNRER